MAFAYVGNASATTGGATELDCNRPAGIAAGNLIIALYAFENVAAGSGPWIIPNNGQYLSTFIGPAQGWQQVCWQSPSAAGVGIEVWAAVHGSGTVQNAKFAASYAAVTVTAAWSGEYAPTGTISDGAVRLATTAQVTGSQPAAPSVVANAGELIIACGGDLMTASKFGTPSGFTNRVDVLRSGAGTVDAALADAIAATAAPTGPITFPNAASSGTTRGSTATLAIRPAPSAPGVGAVVEASMPEGLDLPDGYVLTWAAIDPTTGADVQGVTVEQVSIFGTMLGTGSSGSFDLGPFMLVPGPNA